MPGTSYKDNFSDRADKYVQFRPVYPVEMYNWIFTLLNEREKALDCGTGNGQVANALSCAFQKVYANDISENQLKHAIQKENIIYILEPAEKTSFPDATFDLITVAQAIHWFNFDAFYKEVKRLLKPHGIFAVIGYDLISVDDKMNAIVNHFYNNIIGPYWDPERKYIDEHYQTIPFPFNEIKTPVFKMEFAWNCKQFIGFLETWSAVLHYKKANQKDPVAEIQSAVSSLWKPNELKTITFPVLLRVGKVPWKI